MQNENENIPKGWSMNKATFPFVGYCVVGGPTNAVASVRSFPPTKPNHYIYTATKI